MVNNAKGVYLEPDSSIIEKNLSFLTDSKQDEFNNMFQMPGEQYPSKIVKPFPGFCIKTREIGDRGKFFVNICQIDAIPPPKDITERELAEILESDEASSFRVPMSIGDVRADKDKHGDEARVCDIAVHPNFFRKIEEIALFKSFFVTLVFEGLENKHGIVCTDDKVILKNRKSFGNLQVHRIQQREVDEKMKQVEGRPLIEEIDGGQKTKVEVVSSDSANVIVPEYRLFRKKSNPNVLIGEFLFPNIISSKELTIDLGEDRILIESATKHYLLDIFIPQYIRQATSTSTFNKATKILTITMPLMGG